MEVVNLWICQLPGVNETKNVQTVELYMQNKTQWIHYGPVCGAPNTSTVKP